MSTPSPFESGLRLMEAQQQLAARSLINLIEMVSTTSHRMASDTTAFTQDALKLMNEAATTRDPSSLGDLQKKWADTCMKYSQTQTRASMAFVEQCGLQALNVAAHTSGKAPDETAGGEKPPQTET